MKIVDVRGKLCPEPLIITKREIKAAVQGDSFNVLMDNDIACCNMENFLTELGIKFITEQKDNISSVVFTIGGAPIKDTDATDKCIVAPHLATKSDYVVVLSSFAMGTDEDGSATLGQILMRGYVNALAEQDTLPKALIMYNSGVLIAKKGADTIDALRMLKESGVDILLCGVCVDYYDMKELVEVGRISNMFEITKITSSTGNVVYP